MRKRNILFISIGGIVGVILIVGAAVVTFGPTAIKGSAKTLARESRPAVSMSTNAYVSPLLAKVTRPTLIANSYIVVLKDTAPDKVASVAHELINTYHGQLKHIYTAALHGFSVTMSQAQSQKMAKDVHVAIVQQDWTSPLQTISAQPQTTQSSAPWDLDRLDQPNLPLSGTYTYDTNASNVSVYVLDTGIRLSHAEFGGRAYSADDGQDNNDCQGHGTAVAGIIGGATWGVAKHVKIYSVRTLNCSNAPPLSDNLSTVDWVTANAHRPAVVNISWTTGPNAVLDMAVRNSIQSGVTYVIAAGNSNANACLASPQRVSEGITVGASKGDDRRSYFSNYGPCVTMFAPGENIPTTSFASDTATTTASGTSLSAPQVVGAVALYLSKHPSATPGQVKAALVACATSGIIGNPGEGSPNKLLNTSCDQPIKVTNPGLLRSFQNQATHLQMKATDPSSIDQTLHYSATGLPAGLSINASGLITGTIVSKKENTVVLTVKDSAGNIGVASFEWSIIKGYGSITNVNGTCVDDNTSISNNGNPIQVWGCGQQWTANVDGTLTILGKCLTVSGDATANGTPIVLFDCRTSESQNWQPQANGTLLNPVSGRCLNAPNMGWGTQLTLADCTSTPNQQWTLPNSNSPNILSVIYHGDQITTRGTAVTLALGATDTSVGQTITYSATGLPIGLSINAATGVIAGTPLSEGVSTVTVTVKDSTGASSSASFNWALVDGPILGANGQCVDDNNESGSNGNPILARGCNSSLAQQWTLQSGGTLEVYGKCITALGDATANATPIVLSDCRTAGSQVWQPQANGTLLNPVSGRCLTAPAAAVSGQLTLADCVSGTNQQWRLPVSNAVTITNPGDQSNAIGAAMSLQLNAGSFNLLQTLTYSATGLPAGLAINAATGVISGTPILPGGTSTVMVTVKDGTGAIGATWFNWTIIKGYGSIVGINGDCIDDNTARSNNNNPIQVWRCSQQWTVNANDTLTILGKCLTTLGDGTANATPIVLFDCRAVGSQIWQYQVNGELLNPVSGRCLNAPDAGWGTQLTLADCTNTPNQQWTVPGEVPPRIVAVSNPGDQTTGRNTIVTLALTASDSVAKQTLTYSATGLPTGLSISSTTGVISGTPTTASTSIVTVTAKDGSGGVGATTFNWTIIKGYGSIVGINGDCIDDNTARSNNNNPIQVWGCGQQWAVNGDGTLRILGKCLTVSGDGMANATPIVLFDCRAVGSQIWQPQANGELLNPVSGRCLNAPDAGWGTQLTLADCTGAANQQWRLPLS